MRVLWCLWCLTLLEGRRRNYPVENASQSQMVEFLKAVNSLLDYLALVTERCLCLYHERRMWPWLKTGCGRCCREHQLRRFPFSSRLERHIRLAQTALSTLWLTSLVFPWLCRMIQTNLADKVLLSVFYSVLMNGYWNQYNLAMVARALGYDVQNLLTVSYCWKV